MEEAVRHRGSGFDIVREECGFEYRTLPLESTCALYIRQGQLAPLLVCHLQHVVYVCSVALMEFVLPVFQMWLSDHFPPSNGGNFPGLRGLDAQCCPGPSPSW